MVNRYNMRRSNLGGRRTGRRRGGFRWQIMLLFAAGAAIYYFANQETVPVTGRKQLRTMKPAQEIQLGLQSYQQILADNGDAVLTRGPVVDAVNEIGVKLARQAESLMVQETGSETGFDWAFNVIESPQANAFALPGGYTAVYTGLIPIAENEDGLAVVMGHEIAHALISQYGFALPFSRKHESEADEIGLYLVAMACYDPREAPRLWERMGASGGQTPPEFQSTHPSPATRVADFQRLMPRAIEIYNQSCTNKIQ